MIDFINTAEEANEHEFWPWLEDDEDRLDPEDIGSPDLEKAINVFCMEVFNFLRQHCPEYEDQLQRALRQNQRFSEIIYLPHSCSKSMKPLANLICDWFEKVFSFQVLEKMYAGMDPSFIADCDVAWILSHERYVDIPCRIETFRRLREMWSKVPADADLEYLRRHCAYINMQDWYDDLTEHLKEVAA